MKRALVVSDNHGLVDGLHEALNKYYDCDYYLHLGDVCLSPEEIKPFIAVKGNNDYGYEEYPRERIIEIDNIKFLMIHGSNYYYDLIYKAKDYNIKNVLCGHTHIFEDITIDGVRLMNPGSLNYNRDWSNPCYAILTVDNNNIIFERIDLDLKK